jgi:hypothetical protein
VPTDSASYFGRAQPVGFGAYCADDELLHRDYIDQIKDAALTETQMINFSVPDARIHSVNYIWHRPHMRLITGGVWAWQGVKTIGLSSELFDIRNYPDDPLVAGDLDDFTLACGYHVEVLTPMEKVRITYEDAAVGNAFDVTLTATMPPAMLVNGKHFDQAMRARGVVRLRNSAYAVDSWSIRDRSWGEARREDPTWMPPMYWISAVFSDDLAFHAVGLDGPTPEPSWYGRLDWDGARTTAINRGWVWRSAELTPLTTINITTEIDHRTGYPTAQLLELTDHYGHQYRLTGSVTAASNWSVWSNFSMRPSLTRWEFDDKVGTGEIQLALGREAAQVLP